MWLDAVKAASSCADMSGSQGGMISRAVLLPYLALVCCQTDLERGTDTVCPKDHELLAQKLGMFRCDIVTLTNSSGGESAYAVRMESLTRAIP